MQISSRLNPHPKAGNARADYLRQQAFDNSIHANLIIAPEGGLILLANKAACKLLGYSRRTLETLTSSTVFDTKDPGFEAMHQEKTRKGSATAYVTAISKTGKRLPCEISSANFFGPNRTPLIITAITDMRKVIKTQKHIDIIRDAAVASDIRSAKSKQKIIDLEKEELVARNIVIAMANQEAMDARQLRLTTQQIADAREDARLIERSGIGKELHDNVNQLLGASRMYLELGKRGGQNSEEYFNRSAEYTLTAIEEIRKLTRGLITDIIKHLGLREGIENLCRDMMEITGLDITLELAGFAEESESDKFKLNIFRIVQEQLNNIIKHAAAGKVHISLTQQKKNSILSITDNGIGFDTTENKTGIGLENIQSRAGQFNGTARFISTPGEGCSLLVKFGEQGE